MPEYIIAKSAPEYQAAAKLFREYAAWLGIDLGFQHFEEELQTIAEMYAPPAGGIILCLDDSNFIACVGIRKFAEATAELKRMYVQSPYQGRGIGKELMQRAIILAVSCGYKRIYLDTLNKMTPAINLYKGSGFTETEPYYPNPNLTVVYFKKEL